jgi:hypothetical protein
VDERFGVYSRGRKADKWEILFTVAELADLDTPTTSDTPLSDRLKAAARFIEQQEAEVSELTDSELLRQDIEYILREYKNKYIFTKDIIRLISNENDKWKYYNGVGHEKNITLDQIRRILRPYGIKPEPNPFSIGGERARGYSVKALSMPT